MRMACFGTFYSKEHILYILLVALSQAIPKNPDIPEPNFIETWVT